jgi:RNA polymerase sigma-70 factor, ECF subfamily
MTQAATQELEDTVRRAASGDREAFEALVRKHQPEIYRFFRRACRSDEDARDQCQLAFVRAYRSLSRFEGRSSFRTWLFRIATNLSRNYYRDQGRRREVPLTQEEDSNGSKPRERDVADRKPSTLDRLELGEKREQLRDAVETLPPRQRSVVVLRIYHDLSFAEIAEVESITANNAKVSFCHAVRNLKKAVAAPGVVR